MPADVRQRSQVRRATRPRRSVGWPRFRVAGRPTHEFVLLLATTAVLTVFGLVMTFSASFVTSAAETGDAFEIFQRQLLWCAVGVPLMLAVGLSDYRTARRWAGPLMLVALVAASAVAVPGVGVAANGARRWFDLGPVTFQPTEMCKVAVPLYLAHVLARRWPRLRQGDLHALLFPAVPLLGALAVLVMLEPDLETAALLVAIGGVVLYAAGLPLRILGSAAGIGMILTGIGIAVSQFRRGRFEAWLNPLADPANYGYQTRQGYVALGSGGWFGTGLGEGRGKWFYVPNAHTDFIFAIIGEELGLLGALTVLLLFVALAVGGVRTALRAPDPFGRLLAAGITGWLLMQATINIGSVVGLLPVTGVTLPLVSFGGTSLVFTMLGLGLLLSIARATRAPSDEERSR